MRSAPVISSKSSQEGRFRAAGRASAPVSDVPSTDPNTNTGRGKAQVSAPRRGFVQILQARGVIVVVSLAMSCSIFTSLDGLSGGSGPLDAGGDREAATETPDAPAATPDAPAETPDAPTRTLDARPEANASTPRVWRQLTVAGPPARHSGRMVYDEARRKIVLFGGRGPSASPSDDDTWEWDGTSWSLATATSGPTARRSPGFAYDTARHVALLYGGAGGGPDVWEWNGGAWKLSGVTASPPPPQQGAAIAYDSARRVLVVFGGVSGNPSTALGDTWEWSLSGGFVKRSFPVSPAGRNSHALVYDTARARVVLFGGNTTVMVNDLWEYDGVAWTQRTPATSPAARTAPCAAYDSVRGVTVVFGGRQNDITSALADTWEWDGTTWRTGPAGPPARRSCAMAFDAARNAIIMFGGSPRRVGGTSEAIGDTWVYE